MGFSAEMCSNYLQQIAALPALLKEEARVCTTADMEKTYRPGGWTVKQVFHHLPDSHMNGYIRMKLALTEENPTIRPYEEKEWSALADVNLMPVDMSISLLEALHAKWVALMETLSEEQLRRTYYHPHNENTVSLYTHMGLYAWHGAHHLAHIRLALGRL
jgi:hypothetical protein